MKYVVIIGDGMADFPIDELQGKTPLMVAKKPYMDMMAKEGICGKVNTIPDGFPPGSDVAGMSLFGYDPARFYTGRAPIEAYGMGIEMGERDVAFRCNMVNIGFSHGEAIMEDYSGGQISTEEARVFIELLNKKTDNKKFEFFPGVGYRHIMIWRDGQWEMTTTPPHDITKKNIAEYLPKGKGADTLIEIMEFSKGLFKDHPVNIKRLASNKLPVNSIWLWGQGKKASFPLFYDRFRLKGATVAAVDLIKGISSLAGFDRPFVKGATGYIDTDYKAKAEKALELLEDHDIVYIHIEAPDEASHSGNIKEKIMAIENIDSKIVGPLYENLSRDTRFMVVTDHATPISMKTHFACPVPFAIYDKGRSRNGFSGGFSEAIEGDILDGEGLIRLFIEYRD
ncbi:MAG TPA: cofactor-independent phosphoglycerate mutase [Syntrophorhabdaceae bacterium]|nr:cofactor-independent phosphoglycerate mutase [Syntrophorhabdaceae bacterium]HOL05569.1 cofactor-independent phosphoglycerate mutase [Syntrophorhabdaceae bacterium]HPP41853.1 cofactor-independent phosphoglycerate mutase [Syntrophorhabdaceae bacterium]